MKQILIAILLLISLPTFGQFAFGVKGGVNASMIYIQKENLNDADRWGTDQKPLVGFHLGLYGQIPLGKHFYFIPEMQYAQRGTKDSFGSVNINYLEMPTLFSYAPVKWINIDAGPTVGLNLTNITSGVKGYDTFDISISGGLRFNVHEKISIIGRYNYGVTSIAELSFRDMNNNPDGSAKMYNRNVQFGIGFKVL